MRTSQFVGRTSQVEQIEQHPYHVISGQPRVLLLQGIAGIGKTRFLEEVQTLAQRQGFQVVTGHGDDTLTQPYAPFADLLPRFEAERVLDTRDQDILYDLASPLIPTLKTPTTDTAESDKLQLMMTVSRATTILALRTPMLVIVDDLHWADQSSLDLFAYLAFAAAEERTAPLFLLVSYRPVSPETYLGGLLSRLQREALTQEMDLSGLDEADTRRLLQDLGVRRPTQQLVSAVQEATQGIPLYIEEVVHHLRHSGALYTRSGYLSVRHRALETLQLPPSIAEAIAERIDGLGAAGLGVLTLAACLGDTFSVDRLGMIGEADEAAIRGAIEAGVEHGVLLRESAHVRFAHRLIRQAFTTRLSSEERQRLHLQIAQALERVSADDLTPPVLEIAHHLVEAGALADARSVLAYTRQAGDQAFVIFAWREAVRYYEAAIQAALSIESLMEEEKADVYYQAGMAHFWNQDAGPALDRLENAAEIYRTLGDRRGLAHTRIWQMQLRLMYDLLPLGALPDVQPLHDVLDLLGDAEPLLSGHIMAELSQAYRFARENERANELAQHALDIGRRIRDDRLCARASEALGLAYLGRLHVQPAIDRWQESIMFAKRSDDLYLHTLALTTLPLALHLKGDLDEAETTALEVADMNKARQDWGDYSKTFSHLASLAVARGDFQAAERYAEQTLRLVERSHYPWGGFRSLQAQACATALRGLHEEAEQALEMIIEPGRLFDAPGRFEHVLVRVFRQLARYYVRARLPERLAPLAADLMEVVRYDTYSLAPLCAIIELGEMIFNPAVTERPAEILAETVERGVLLTSGWCFVIPRALGLAAMSHGEWEAASDHLVHAIRVAQAAEAGPELARAYLDYARLRRLLGYTGKDAIVLGLLAHAIDIFNGFDMVPHSRMAFAIQESILNPPTSLPDDPPPPPTDIIPPPPTRNGDNPIC